MFNTFKIVLDGDHFNRLEYMRSFPTIETAKNYIYDEYRKYKLERLKLNFPRSRLIGTTIINIHDETTVYSYHDEFDFGIKKKLPKEIDFPNELIDTSKKIIFVEGIDLSSIDIYKDDFDGQFIIQKITFDEK